MEGGSQEGPETTGTRKLSQCVLRELGKPCREVRGKRTGRALGSHSELGGEV